MNYLFLICLLFLVSCASGSKKPACSQASPFEPCTSEWRPDHKPSYDPNFNPDHHLGKPITRVNTKK